MSSTARCRRTGRGSPSCSPARVRNTPACSSDLVRPGARRRGHDATIDAVMTARGYQTFAQMAWDNPGQLGTDIWVTQIAMLLADLIVHSAIVDFGIQPDLVAGHSYGEFAALTAAGVWDLEGRDHRRAGPLRGDRGHAQRPRHDDGHHRAAATDRAARRHLARARLPGQLQRPGSDRGRRPRRPAQAIGRTARRLTATRRN